MTPTQGISRTHCIRCGECCLRSSPTLQSEDAPLVTGGHLEGRELYTIRAGELVRDPVRNELRITGRELIKVREKADGGGCVYYDAPARACRIYEYRPAQCAALTCWDTARFMKVFNGPKASRKEI